MKRLILAGAVAALPLAGCADMNQTQQRALSGTAMGAGGGAVIGAIAGNAGLGAGIGAVAGLAGGLIYDKERSSRILQRGLPGWRHATAAKPAAIGLGSRPV